MMSKTLMIRKKIWDMVMVFVIANGYGGVLLFLQSMRNQWMARYGAYAPMAGGCAA